MIQLKNIHKEYKTGDFTQVALDDISLDFGESGFYSIIGKSGSGKTTLLNIIGGLDRYDRGDIIIDGISTKKFKDRDWDAYRSHSIGFIFQSYNLIPHQTILSNVELAMTINNVPASERKQRALAALSRVGLAEHVHKKPNQLSGGQMQRVAIARALVNNPKIILADEPTGALDTKTSVQVMDILKEISKDKLVIMVTHNPELAKQYSTRLIEMRDGVILSDTGENEKIGIVEAKNENKKFEWVAMPLATSLKLSLNNLISKAKRTILVAFAGSIGIIGISMIMSISNGANDYIRSMEEQTLSEYPLSITRNSMDFTSMMTMGMNMAEEREGDKVYEQEIISSMFGTVKENDLGSLRLYLESGQSDIKKQVSAIEYSYGITPYIYKINEDGHARQVSPDSVITNTGLSTFASLMANQTTVFSSLPEDDSIYKKQYDVLAGRWPEKSDELVLILTYNNRISDLALYNLGLKDPSELDELIEKYQDGLSENDITPVPGEWEFSEVLGQELKLVNIYDTYEYDKKLKCWTEITEKDRIDTIAKDGKTLTIVGIVRPNSDSTSPVLKTGIAYPLSLIYELVDNAENSDAVAYQLQHPDYNIFTGKEFSDTESGFELSDLFSADDMGDIFELDTNKLTFDKSAFDGMNLDGINLEDYVDASSLSDVIVKISQTAIDKIFKDVTVNVTRESLSQLFTDLYKDFLLYGDNNPQFDITKLAPSIQEYLQSAEAKAIIQDKLSGEIGEAIKNIFSSDKFRQDFADFVSRYIQYATDNGLDPSQPNTISRFMETDVGKALMQKLSDDIAGVMGDIVASQQAVEELVSRLSKGYEEYAQANSLPTLEIISENFSEYLRTDRANKIIMENAGKMIDLDKVKENTDEISEDVLKIISNTFSTQLNRIAGKIGTTLGNQIEKAVTTAMKDYMNQLGKAFSSPEGSFNSIINKTMSAESMKNMLTSMFSNERSTMENNLKKLGYADLTEPDTITFYPVDFNAKNRVVEILNEYNDAMKTLDEEKVIIFSDTVGTLMSSVTSIIDTIGYVLIAFVSVSLIVSSIMIGIITYISVLERKKEIGILRAMGASKHNITQIFNCETIITGFLAGTFGVIITNILLIPANQLVQHLTGNPSLHGFLPISSALSLIALSIILTTIGGLIPSKSAAKQDPVIALRAE